MNAARLARLLRMRRTTANVMPVEAEAYREEKRSISIATGPLRSWCQNLIDEFPEHRHLKMGHATILLLMENAEAKLNKLLAGGRVSIGKCSKARPKDKVLANLGLKPGWYIDFVITVSGDWYGLVENAEGAEMAKLKMLGLLDHELCHAGAKIAGRFFPPIEAAAFAATLGKDHLETCPDIKDDEGRILVRFYYRNKESQLIWKVRKHDLEEFGGVVARQGAWSGDVKRFVDVLQDNPETPLLCQETQGGTP